MFICCNNNPINYTDISGAIPKSVLDDNAFFRKTRGNPMTEWSKKGVTYDSFNGEGGRINNSKNITDSNEIRSYANYLVNYSKYQSDFAGSLDAVVFEWELHNLLYENGPKSLKDNAESVDLGSTIFADRHHGAELIMWAAYQQLFPEEYKMDLLTYLSR